MSENNFKINEHSLRTAISKVEPDKIVTRGYNQRDLIEKIRYSDMVFLLLKGRLPSIKEGKLFNHVLVSFCDFCFFTLVPFFIILFLGSFIIFSSISFLLTNFPSLYSAS